MGGFWHYYVNMYVYTYIYINYTYGDACGIGLLS